MTSTAILNSTPNSSSSDRLLRKKKKKKLQTSKNQSQNHLNTTTTTSKAPWKSEAQQQAYSSKLLNALRQVHVTTSPKRVRAVREAADRVLAVAAKGRTRWSRSILKNRLKFKFMKSRRQRVTTVTGNGRLPKKPRVNVLRLKTKNLPAVQRKAKVLSRLVPGCKKESLPVVLEEATDYIAALEMQVKAMSALAELLSGGSRADGPGPVNHHGPIRSG